MRGQSWDKLAYAVDVANLAVTYSAGFQVDVANPLDGAVVL
jgi:hypothetical protein